MKVKGYRMIKKLIILSAVCTTLFATVPLTPNQLHATLGIVTNFILDDAVTHHGKSYAPVTSPHTGRIWLDRNIGANKKCTSADDASCYGDYFQWGRGYDGHESSVDSTTTLAADINAAGAEFIRGSADWASTDLGYANARATNWLKTDGSSVCPVGYRVPLKSELEAEVIDISNAATAYTNFLKLPTAGYRSYIDGNPYFTGDAGIWSIQSSLDKASYFYLYDTSILWVSGTRAYGYSVRCIKHEGDPIIHHNGTTYATVTSPYTGKVWLDRNLGASQVCSSFDDPLCYGDYYQWGRNADGHEDSGSETNDTLATQIDPVQAVVDGKFITNIVAYRDWALGDATGATRSANWSKTDGSSVCPIGFRVPNITELSAETVDEDVINRDTAFTNFLKL